MAFYRPRVYRKVLALTLVCALFSCTKSEDEGGEEAELPAGQVNVLEKTYEAACDDTGKAVISFKLKENAEALQIIAFTDAKELKLQSLRNPQDEIIYDAAALNEAKATSATAFQNSPNTFNFPVLASSENVTYKAGIYRADYLVKPVSDNVPLSSFKVMANVLTKRDGDPLSGVLPVNIIYAGPVASDESSREEINNALDDCADIAREGGIVLSRTYVELPEAPSTLPNPRLGSQYYEDVGITLDPGVNLYFGVDVERLKEPENEIGIAGAVPGSFMPSVRSAIAFSISEAAGNDGEFEAEDEDGESNDGPEKRIFAETVCHELFHYLGLFDTVTFQGDTVVNADILDSEKCFSKRACEGEDDAHSNIMFPFPLEDTGARRRSYFARDKLSAGQIAVINKYVGVD